MSSIPTSLIIVLLVAAWLVVLVPMFARRREAVPESNDDATGFRVLRRERKLRKRAARANFDRYDMDVTTTDSDYPTEVRAEADEPLADDAADDWAAEQERAARRRASRQRDEYGDRGHDYRDEFDGPGRGEFARDEFTREEFDREEFGRGGYDGRDHRDDSWGDYRDGAHPDDVRPVPTRKGRGGFDPDAAEATRMFKYRRRRRVLLLLVALLLGSAAAGYFLNPMAWAGTAAVGLLLVGFLVYLRRQVRIEAEIRARRMARLRRARQIRPEPRRAYDRPAASPYRPAAPRTSAADPSDGVTVASTVPPAAYRSGRVVLDLDDDDPAFEDLERYQMPVYRRQAG